MVVAVLLSWQPELRRLASASRTALASCRRRKDLRQLTVGPLAFHVEDIFRAGRAAHDVVAKFVFSTIACPTVASAWVLAT